MVILDSKTFPGVSVDILEHLGMRVRDIEGHGVITGRAIVSCRLATAGCRHERVYAFSGRAAVRAAAPAADSCLTAA